jgi:hypothetical protein
MWRVINKVVAESAPTNREDGRKRTEQALLTLGKLIRERRVLRKSRKWIAVLDCADEIVPLEDLCWDKVRRI